jgi:putative DNA primase/helicase
MDNQNNMHRYSLDCINIPTEVYLNAFYGLNETVCFRILADKPDKAFSGYKCECELEAFSNLEGELHDHNSRGRGVFNAVNVGGHSDAAITDIKAQFFEMDDVPLEEQLKRIQEFPLEPSIIVKTRKSLHVYFLMRNAQVAKFRHIQKRLVAHFGADPACVNESRVMRVPNFYHCKAEPLMVGCIKFNPELRYTQEQLEEHLPAPAAVPAELWRELRFRTERFVSCRVQM